jgi:hypothetical protein
MNYKEFIRKHKKIITLLAIGLGILLIVVVVYKIKNSNDNNVESPSTSVNSNATLKILNEKVSDNGRLIFLSFYDPNTFNLFDLFDQDKKYTNALIENINFRKSIYHSLNRKDLEQKNDNFKLSSSPVLFTKAFFNDNHVYFPAQTFPFNEEDAKAYKDDKLENDGFDEEKALNLLQKAWDDLTTEQKQENYKLNLFIKREYLEEAELKNLTNSILKQIKNLFTTFINKNHLLENRIKMQIVHENKNTEDPSQNANMSLDIIQEKYEQNEENYEENYYLDIINNVLNNGIGEKTITLNFSPLKIYLDKIKQQGNTIDTQFFSGLQSKNKAYPGVNPQTGLFTSSHKEFLDFYDDVIFKLLPIGSNNAQEQQLIQQTYEEIFKKVLALIKDYRFHIPLVNWYRRKSN